MPSMKLLRKEHVGSKLKRVYDKPMTPFERVIASKQGDQVKIAELEKLYKTLNPFDLAKTIENKLEAILKLANRRQSPKVTAVQKTEQKEKRPLTKVEKETFERLSNIFPGLIIHAKDSKRRRKKRNLLVTF